jgi:hypothetical protein
MTDLSRKPFYRALDVEIGDGNAISCHIIGANYLKRQLLIFHTTCGTVAEQRISQATREAGIVIRGTIELIVDGDAQTLRNGDGFYFDSCLPHRYRNVGNEPYEIISALTPPTY